MASRSAKISNKKLDVIYIAGSGRSGSTIMDRVLGTYPGAASFNEVYRLLIEGVDEDNFCACGEAFSACSFWQNIVADVLPREEDIKRVRYLHNRFDHTRHVLRLLLFPFGRKYRRELDEYCQWLGKLYFSLSKYSGCPVLVDSSKVPSRALLLSRVPGVQVHLVHLVRDLHAVTNAWMKEKFNPAAGESLPTYGINRSILFWYARQFMTELLRLRLPYRRVLYEDFARRPAEVFQPGWIQTESLRNERLPFEEDGSIILKPLHSIGGNPDRFSSGPTVLKLDEKWRHEMPAGARKRISTIGFPLLWRYGYTRSESQRKKELAKDLS